MPILAAVVATATVVMLGALVWLHAAPTGLHPISDPVSQYALTRFRAGYWTAAFAAAVAGAATAVELPMIAAGAGPAAVMLWLFAAARAVIPLLPMDAPGGAATATGRMHNALAVVAFATATAAAFLAMGPLNGAGLTALGVVSLVAGIVMAAGSAGTIAGGIVPGMRRAVGLTERIIYLGIVGWFLTLAVGTLTMPTH